MQTHEFFRQVTAPAVPSCDAAAMLRQLQQAPRPRRFAARYLAGAAVMTLVLLAGAVFLPRLQTTPPAPQPADSVLSLPPDESGHSAGTSDVQTPDEQVPDVRTPETQLEVAPDEIHINELDETFQVDAALSLEVMEILEAHQELWDLTQLRAYWGWDPLPGELPSDLKPVFDADSRWRYCNAEGLLWDQFSFTWRAHPGSETYDPLERTLTLTVGTEEPFVCGVLVTEDEMLYSTVAGVPMLLGHRSMAYGPYTKGENGTSQPAGYYHVFVAKFEKNGQQLRVVTENLTQAEYIAVLQAIAKQ